MLARLINILLVCYLTSHKNYKKRLPIVGVVGVAEAKKISVSGPCNFQNMTARIFFWL